MKKKRRKPHDVIKTGISLTLKNAQNGIYDFISYDVSNVFMCGTKSVIKQ